MEEFWVQLLAILTLLTQTSSASDTPELIGAVGGSVTFYSPDTDTNAALWSFGNNPIVSVAFEDPPRPVFSKEKYKTRFTVSERGRALTISQLSTEDAGTYSVTIGRKISTFTLLVYRELTEPTVTCDSQKCSGSICSFSLRCSMTGAGFGNISYTWRVGLWLWDEGSVVLNVHKSSWNKLNPLTCTARNAVSTRSVTVTIHEGLCPGARSGFGIGIGVTVLLLVLLVFFCKCKDHWLACMARRVSGSAEIPPTARLGHQDCPQATSCMGPEPGVATDQHRPEPGVAMDQLGPEPGLTQTNTDQCQDQSQTSTDQYQD